MGVEEMVVPTMLDLSSWLLMQPTIHTLASAKKVYPYYGILLSKHICTWTLENEGE